MADNLTLVVFVNSDDDKLYLYAKGTGKGANNYVAAACQSISFDNDFFERFEKVLKLYKQKYPSVSTANVSLILPDRVFLMDTVAIPNMGKKAVDGALNLAIGTIYKNRKDLDYATYLLSQNKVTSVYGMVGVRKDLLAGFNEVCSRNHYNVQNITFVSNAMADGAIDANNKLKSATCLLLDIKETVSRFAFLNKGRTVGCFTLPFGYSTLHKNRLAAEDTLFDHASAELLVLNAKERARAKQLTVMEDIVPIETDTVTTVPMASDSEDFEVSDASAGGRKLPKFMLREIPTDHEGFVYENFRIFEKWALELIANNSKIAPREELDTVYVNMPKEFRFLFNVLNREEKENGVRFMPMIPDSGQDTLGGNGEMLELMGGFCVKQSNRHNNF